MDSIDKLTQFFKEFPGIGPRQSQRFVYFLISKDKSYRLALAKLIENISKSVAQCTMCERYFTLEKNRKTELCNICSDKSRDDTQLLVVSRDVDLEAVEKSATYRGQYFVLGGSIPILHEHPEKVIRLSSLQKNVDARINKLKEVIFALNVTPEGENTVKFLRNYLAPLAKNRGFKIENLGKGLSTGLELEYSDSETLRNAFKNKG